MIGPRGGAWHRKRCGRAHRCARRPRTRALLRIARACLLAGLALLPACRRGPDPHAVARDYNVLLITLDTTRADHLGCYGNPTVRTPNLDALAAGGVRFTQCTATVPITLPSHTSIMTGTYPFVHGVRDNGHVVPEDNLTLAEVFKQHGYTTGAVVSAYVLNSEFRLTQGFDTYDDIWQQRAQTTLYRYFQSPERPADEAADHAIEWLDKHRNDRFFLWVHFFDPHQPYEPPEPYLSQYPHPYMGEIAFMDAHLGRIIQRLRELDLEKRTLVVVVADHGEGLGDHGEETHLFFLYDTTLTVPLIFYCPTLLPAGLVNDSQVRTIDVAPTILDLVGLPAKPDAQGVSLRPLLFDPQATLPIEAYAETLGPLYAFRFSPLRALRADGWKYIHAPRPELFHVATDAGETTNLVETEPERAARMRDRLRELIAEAGTGLQSGGGLTTSQREQLMALGYLAGRLDGTGTSGEELSELDLFEPRGPDVKDHKDEIRYMTLAWSMRAHGNFDEAEKLLRQAIDLAPDNIEYRLRLAELLRDRKDLDGAIAEYRRCLELDPDHAEAHLNYGVVLAMRDRLDEAVREFEKALQLRPDYEDAHRNLAMALTRLGRSDEAARHFAAAGASEIGTELAQALVLQEQGRLDEAFEHYRKVLEASPNHLDALLACGGIELARQHYTEALGYYRRALELAPSVARAHYGVGTAYLFLGRTEQALEHLRRAVQLRPDFAEAHNNLGLAYGKRGDIARAVEHFRQALRINPDYADAHNNLGIALQMQGHAAEAQKHFEQADRLKQQEQNASPTP